MATESKSSFFRPPATRLGWWAFGLGAGFALLMIFNSTIFLSLPQEPAWWNFLLPFYGITMMASGLAAGIVGLIAILKQKQRSGLVWFSLLPGAFSLLFLLGEFLFPH